jgi:hypothetical protein
MLFYDQVKRAIVAVYNSILHWPLANQWHSFRKNAMAALEL